MKPELLEDLVILRRHNVKEQRKTKEGKVMDG